MPTTVTKSAAEYRERAKKLRSLLKPPSLMIPASFYLSPKTMKTLPQAVIWLTAKQPISAWG